MLYTVLTTDTERIQRKYLVEADSPEEAEAKQEQGQVISSTDVEGSRQLSYFDVEAVTLR